MPVNEKTGKCKDFAFTLVSEHVQTEILKLNGITSVYRIIVMEVEKKSYTSPCSYQ